MPVSPKILYFDLELGPKDRIAEVGAVLGNRELHERNTDRLVSWAQEADYICGHNVVAHDLPLLRKHLGTAPLRRQTGERYVVSLKSGQVPGPQTLAQHPVQHSLTLGVDQGQDTYLFCTCLTHGTPTQRPLTGSHLRGPLGP
jgi:hypothetical protein